MMHGQLIKPLHGLRGMAAVTVIAGHSVIPGVAALGVVLFFVLSGFLMGKLYLPESFDSRAVWRYLSARIARIYPLFAFVVIGAGYINYMIPEADIFYLEIYQIKDNLLFIGSNMTIWTISVEFQFYVLFILYWYLKSKIGYENVITLAIIIVGFSWAIWLGSSAERVDITSYIHVFFIGVLIASTENRAKKFRRQWAHHALIAALGLYVTVFLVAHRLGINREIYANPWALVACGTIVWASMAAGNCLINRVLSMPFLVWLGEISFGLYLFHRPVPVLFDLMFPSLPPVLALPAKLFLVFVAAQLAYVAIEKPCRSALRAWSERLGQPGQSTRAQR